jgi:hypothetical protein
MSGSITGDRWSGGASNLAISGAAVPTLRLFATVFVVLGAVAKTLSWSPDGKQPGFSLLHCLNQTLFSGSPDALCGLIFLSPSLRCPVHNMGERVALTDLATQGLGAFCLDGSPPQYYISPGLESKMWMIHHEVCHMIRHELGNC